ncbi:hypothetical protein [Candidatus Uabimicrobium amorphum]|uniref:Uncharacterized protein n=1 Tax=Uabimicrobium amorphum TaxID=2596890 RepID=A0A5S9IR05_UABAM|nr:hypothetical protein [Candidatus Uabimicrobium amorphum]BBM86304.1 hypothetical protein UABAM_04690 [Candidatus Uabimicrobium amorphum]
MRKNVAQALARMGKKNVTMDEITVIDVLSIIESLKGKVKRTDKDFVKVSDKLIPALVEFANASNWYWQSQTNKILERLTNRILWDAYENNDVKKISQKYLKILEKSNDKSYLDTVAAIYAWQKNEEKAYHYSSIALDETPKRIRLLLRGKTPQQVEKEIKNENK